MTPQSLAQQWHTDESVVMARRRAVMGLSLVSMAMMGLIALYQVGAIDGLPDPPVPGFDADAVHGSREAYALFATPDAVLGLGSYAATMTLAAAGGKDRAKTHPWLPLALGAKVGFDLLQGGRLLVNEVVCQRALSLWSLATIGATVATGPLVFPEVRAAVRCLLPRRHDSSAVRGVL